MQTETLQSTILHVTGMTCGGCTSAVTRALVAVDGVHNVNVSLATGEAKVAFDEKITSPDKLKLAVAEAGYGVAENDVIAAKMKGKSGCCC